MNGRSYVVTLTLGSIVVSSLAVGFASARQRMQTVETASAEMPAEVRKTGAIVDGVLQERFRRRLEVFGVSRIASPRDGNMIHARSTTQSDIARFKEADALDCDYRVFFHPTRDLSADKLTSRPRQFAGSVEPLASRSQDLSWSSHEKDFVQAVGKSAVASDSALRRGMSVDKPVGDWWLTDWWLMARPVKAEASCISCHTAAKTGETLGVLVYTVRKLPLTGDARQEK